MSALHVCYKFYFEPTEITYCFFIPFSLLLLFLPYSLYCFFASYNLPKNGNTMSLLYLCLNGSLHARTHFGNRKNAVDWNIRLMNKPSGNKSDSCVFAIWYGLQFDSLWYKYFGVYLASSLRNSGPVVRFNLRNVALVCQLWLRTVKLNNSAYC